MKFYVVLGGGVAARLHVCGPVVVVVHPSTLKTNSDTLVCSNARACVCLCLSVCLSVCLSACLSVSASMRWLTCPCPPPAVWPAKWPRHCLPLPYTYFIKEKSINHTVADAAFDRSYIGEAGLFLVNVPAQVDEEDLVAWFRAGMVGSDERLIELNETIRQSEDQLLRVKLAMKL